MKARSKNSLLRSLLNAILSYDETNPEEQGGFILKKNNSEDFEFVPVKNFNTGDNIALGLYTADQTEFNNKVALRTIDDDWEIYASFHTHPRGMRALPSSIDIRYLFKNFPVNYIYAHGKELNCFELKDGLWQISNRMTFNAFNGPWPATALADLTDQLFPKKEGRNSVTRSVWEPVEC